MEIPKKLKIGGHEYTVELVDPETLDNDCGKMNPRRNLIQISSDMPQSQLEETLLHEIIHACNGGLPEETVDGLAHSLYQVLKDNKLI